MTCAELLEKVRADGGIGTQEDLSGILGPIEHFVISDRFGREPLGGVLVPLEDGIVDIPWDELLPGAGYEQLLPDHARAYVDPQDLDLQDLGGSVSEQIRWLQKLESRIQDFQATERSEKEVRRS